MELKPIPLTDAVCTLIETANYDGYHVTPYQAVECPVCHAVAAAATVGGHMERTEFHRCLGKAISATLAEFGWQSEEIARCTALLAEMEGSAPAVAIEVFEVIRAALAEYPQYRVRWWDDED